MNFIFLLAFLLPKKELPYPDTRIDLFYLVLFTRYNEMYGELLTYVWNICQLLYNTYYNVLAWISLDYFIVRAME